MMEETIKNQQDEIEESNVDILEFSLNDEEIEEWIDKLNALKVAQTSISLDVDDENQLLINYDENENYEEEEE